MSVTTPKQFVSLATLILAVFGAIVPDAAMAGGKNQGTSVRVHVLSGGTIMVGREEVHLAGIEGQWGFINPASRKRSSLVANMPVSRCNKWLPANAPGAGSSRGPRTHSG